MRNLASACRRGTERWSTMPIAIFFFGILSAALLFWTYRISERQLSSFALADSLMDLQIKAVVGHLWIEESVSGDRDVGSEKALSELDDAVRISQAILYGGKSEGDFILSPLKDERLRRQMEDVARLLAEFRQIAIARLEKPGTSGIGSLLDQRFDDLFIELSAKAKSLELIVETTHIVDHQRSTRLFFGIFLVWPAVILVASKGLWSRELRRKRAEESLRKAKNELEERVVERTAELHDLSARLLTAQETERKRISRELHDEMGQSLTLVKLRLRAVANALPEGRDAAKVECDDILRFIDVVIEDMRQLSRDLSPAILDDLGLTASIRWMAERFAATGHLRLRSSITDVDGLFPESARVTIYRMLQEALTNIGKHSHAENVTLIVEQEGDMVSFIVEDDGRGFDVSAVLRRNAAERGIGLATMIERARMLGGKVDIWSQEGRGARIRLSVPVDKRRDGIETVQGNTCR